MILIPDRLPSLVLLVGCWVPAAMAGRVAAEIAHRRKRVRFAVTYAWLSAFVLASTGVWFLINLGDMPPYIPGATADPTFASPEAVRGLAVFSSAVVVPVSAIACAVAFRLRLRSLADAAGARASH